MENKPKNLVRLKDVMAKLIAPGREKPVPPQTVYQIYLRALHIVPVAADGGPKERHNEEAYICEADAARIMDAFRVNNWRKFEAAEKAKTKGGK